jgi:hypothetical protein
LETAKMLNRFMHSMDTLREYGFAAGGDSTTETTPTIVPAIVPATNATTDTLIDTPINTPIDTSAGHADVHIAAPAEIPVDTLQLLTAKCVQSTHDVARNMWACLRGISAENASDYIKQWSLADVVKGIPPNDLAATKLPNGKKINKRVLESLRTQNKNMHIRLLSTVPGISKTTAAELLSGRELSNLLTQEIAELKIGKKQARLGTEKGNRILECFNYKTH